MTLCHRPCHERFTAKITGSPNMVCTVDHGMEDLQHRILDFFKYCSLHCHVKKDRAGKERKDSDGRGNSNYRARKESEKRE